MKDQNNIMKDLINTMFTSNASPFYIPNFEYQVESYPPWSGSITQSISNKPSLDIKDENDDVIVIIDVPGVEKDNIKVRLVNEKLLELECEQKNEHEDKKENYCVRERSYGYVKRMIPLPAHVTELDAKTSFKNGVLELRFKKIKIAKKEYLKLE